MIYTRQPLTQQKASREIQRHKSVSNETTLKPYTIKTEA